MACTFSTSQLPKVARTCCALYILTSKCASRHNGVHFFDIATSKSAPKLRCFVLYILTSKCASRHNNVQFFISHLARWLRTRRFSEPTFRPSGATNHWKNTVFRDFPTFSRICIFFLLTLSLLLSSLFYSSLLSDSSHLCFSSVHIVGCLTSKLPSVSIEDQTWYSRHLAVPETWKLGELTAFLSADLRGTVPIFISSAPYNQGVSYPIVIPRSKKYSLKSYEHQHPMLCVLVVTLTFVYIIVQYYSYIYIYLDTHININMYIYIYIYIYVHIYIYTCKYVYIYMYICTYIYTCKYVYIYICT